MSPEHAKAMRAVLGDELTRQLFDRAATDPYLHARLVMFARDDLSLVAALARCVLDLSTARAELVAMATDLAAKSCVRYVTDTTDPADAADGGES